MSAPPLDADTIAFAGRCFDMARAGHAAELADLIAHGLPANLTNDKGDTLLILAAYHGHEDTVAALLDAGADPERANDRGQTALGAAAFKGFEPVMRLLIARGASSDGRPEGGRTPLMVAAMFDRVAAVDLLLGAGADPRLVDGAGMDAVACGRAMGAGETPARIEAWIAARPSDPP